MSEQINAIVAEARALLASATAMPWRKGTGASVVADVPVPEMSGSDELRFYGGHLVGESIVERNAGAIVFAVNNLGTLCDALERSQFALEWWAADRAICVEALHEAWAVMDSMARAAGVVGTFLEQAAPLLRPDASGNVNAPNHVTAAFTDGVQSYEVTIRREGGKTPADIIGELTARAGGAEHARDIFLDGLGRIGAMCLAVLGDEWEGAPHDEMVGGLIDRVEEAEDRAHDEVNRRIETSHDLHIRLEQAEAQAAVWREHTSALVAAMKTWGSWEDGVPDASDAGECGDVGRAFNAARDALAPDMNLKAWRCSACGETAASMTSAWRWNGSVWQHTHADAPQAGHFDAVYVDPARTLLDRLTAAEARVADLESAREEQAAKLRRHLDELQAATAYIKDLEAENAQLEGRTAGLCDCMAAPFAESKGASDCPECKGEGAVIVEAGK